MKRRGLCLALALVLVLSLLPTAALAADGDFVIKNGELTKYNGSGGAVVIPDGVTAIGDEAFQDCTSLTSITIPDSVTSIGGWAFLGCTGLTSITIPDSVTAIGDDAFHNCTSLTSITIPGSVTSIGEFAFYGCSGLTSVTIPDSVTSIREGAFCDCNSLTGITIPDSVTDIGGGAFSGCSSLTAIEVAAGNRSYCDEDGILFSKDKKTLVCYPAGKQDKVYTIPDSVTRIGDRAFYNCSSLTSITIPDSVTRIGDRAFYNCSSLTSITIPDSVTRIAACTFQGCSSLTSITIPDSVTDIGVGAFFNCTGLTAIEVAAGNRSYCDEDGVLFYKDKKNLVCYPTGKQDKVYTIPDSVTSIRSYAFFGCSSLTSITIPDSVTSIGDCTFQGCSSLTSITIPDSVTSIEAWAFYDCSSLTDIYYTGTEAQWEAVNIDGFNDPLESATIHYNSPMPAAKTAYASTQDVNVDGRSVEFQCYALKDENGNMTNYIKLRDLADILNGSAAQFQVGWDGSVTITTRTAYTPNGSEGNTPYSGNRAYEEAAAVTKVNGQAADLSAFVLNDDDGGGYTYYQLRDLGKVLGFNVGWAAEKGIFVETGKPYDPAN